MKASEIFFSSLLLLLLLCTAVSAADYTGRSRYALGVSDRSTILTTEITGYPDGSYKPEKSVTRAEFLTLVRPHRLPGRVEDGGERQTWWKSAYRGLQSA